MTPVCVAAAPFDIVFFPFRQVIVTVFYIIPSMVYNISIYIVRYCGETHEERVRLLYALNYVTPCRVNEKQTGESEVEVERESGLLCERGVLWWRAIPHRKSRGREAAVQERSTDVTP